MSNCMFWIICLIPVGLYVCAMLNVAIRIVCGVTSLLASWFVWLGCCIDIVVGICLC